MDLVARLLLMEAELHRVVHVLRSAQVEAVVFKGIPLSRRLGLGLSGRGPIGDNDLLVHRDQVELAMAALAETGYRPKRHRVLADQLRAGFQIPLRRQVPGRAEVELDVHWAPFPPKLYPVEESVVWSHVENFDLPGGPVAVFDRPLTMVHLASHWAQGGFAEDRPLTDLSLAWRRWGGDAGREAVNLAGQLGIHHLLDYALRAAETRGLVSGPRPTIGSARARRLARVLPCGRQGRPAPDYPGMLLALSLAGPRRLPGALFAAIAPPQSWEAAVSGQVRPAWSTYAHRTARLTGSCLAALQPGLSTRPRDVVQPSCAQPTKRDVYP